MAVTAPPVPKETRCTERCLSRGWVFSRRLSPINPSWMVICAKPSFCQFSGVFYFNFFFLFNQFYIFPKILWRWRFCNPRSPFQGVLILTRYNTLSISS